jgi:XTP/dITP diphosphohydrolase
MRRAPIEELVVATHNAGKLAELRALLAPYRVKVVSSGELCLPEPEETENSFLGNARIKAHAAAQASGHVALGDDSGLEVDALKGAPGVYTANWAEIDGRRDFSHAMRLTHSKLLERRASEPWTARFRCTLVLAWPDGEEESFEGTVEGTLVWPPRGKEGHGYDPMFQPSGHDQTFAEMHELEKNRISHRARAIAALIERCFT